MNILKKLRTERGYNQQKLAELLCVSRSTIAMWETEKAEPNRELLLKLADIFEVSVDHLLGRTSSSAPTSFLDKELEGVDFALFGEVKDLTDDEKEDVLSFIKFTKSKRNDVNEA